MKTILILLLIQSFSVYKETSGLDITSFIQPCAANDPNLNECVKSAGQKLIPQVAGGLSEFNLPSMDPLLTPEMYFKDNSGDNSLVVHYTNIVQTGFSAIQIENADVDLKHEVMTFKLRYPLITFTADYTSEGQFYGFDVNGHGKANISVWNAFSSFVLKYRVVSDHIKQNSIIIGFSFDKIYLDYTNLMLNNDKELSESAGHFINENSAEIVNAFKPELEKFYADTTKDFLQILFEAVPYSVLFRSN